MVMKKLIVFDSDHPLAVNNRCFEPQYAEQGAGYFFWSALYNEAAKNNIRCVTSDHHFRVAPDSSQKAYYIS